MKPYSNEMSLKIIIFFFTLVLKKIDSFNLDDFFFKFSINTFDFANKNYIPTKKQVYVILECQVYNRKFDPVDIISL